jgi:hypothetical protein
LTFAVTRVNIKIHRLWTYYLWVSAFDVAAAPDSANQPTEQPLQPLTQIAIVPVVFLVWIAFVTVYLGPTRLNDRVSGEQQPRPAASHTQQREQLCAPGC